MTRERREFARIRLEVPACLLVYQGEARRVGAIVNLSLGGCYFPTPEELTPGQDCQLELTAGEGLETETIILAGIIARKDDGGVGIRFTDITPKCREALARIISRYGSAQPGS